MVNLANVDTLRTYGVRFVRRIESSLRLGSEIVSLLRREKLFICDMVMSKNRNNENIEANSKLVSGVVRSIPAFLIGGPIGLFANGIYTILNVKKEIDDEKIRQQKRCDMLSNNVVKCYHQTEQETEMMIRDYNEKFKPLRLTKIITIR